MNEWNAVLYLYYNNNCTIINLLIQIQFIKEDITSRQRRKNINVKDK